MRRIYHWLYLGSKWDCGYAFPRSTQKPLLAKPPYGVRERLRRRAPAIKREQVARSDVVYMHDVEPCIDVCRHPTGSGVEDDPARRRGLHIAGPDRCRGIHDDDWNALLRRIAYQLFCQVLRPLVVADHVRER